MPDTQPSTPTAASPRTPAPHGTMAFARFMTARMAEDEITRVAASLSFTTTLQIVPALALVLAMLSAFPAFADLRASVLDFILGNLMPDTGMKMKEQFTAFLDAAGKLTAFGVLGLAVTALLLLLTIENSFNKIFKVVRRRPFLTRVLVFWAAITIGPFLMGLSFTLFGYFAVPKEWLGEATPPAVTWLLGQLAPTVLAWVGLTLIYVVFPNRRVLWSDALIGAGVAAVLLAVLRLVFALYVGSMTSYKAVYGALAAFPVFLVWIYLAWIFVMAGAVIAATLPDWRYTKAGASSGAVGRIALALEVVAKLAAAQNVGSAIGSRALAKALSVPDVELMRVLDTLRVGRFVASTDDGGWMLSRDLDRIALADIVHQFGLGLDFPDLLAASSGREGEMVKRLVHHLGRAAESERAVLSATLSKIVAAPEETSVNST